MTLMEVASVCCNEHASYVEKQFTDRFSCVWGWRPTPPHCFEGTCPAMWVLVKQCWSDEQGERPDFKHVVELLDSASKEANFPARVAQASALQKMSRMSTKQVLKSEKATNKKIEKMLKTAKTKDLELVKFVLLGTGNAGKSTFFKQMQRLHSNVYED